jgi:hypothetical protein
MTRDLPGITYTMRYNRVSDLISILLRSLGAWRFLRNTKRIKMSELIFIWSFHWWVFDICSKCPPSGSAHILARLWIECGCSLYWLQHTKSTKQYIPRASTFYWYTRTRIVPTVTNQGIEFWRSGWPKLWTATTGPSTRKAAIIIRFHLFFLWLMALLV